MRSGTGALALGGGTDLKARGGAAQVDTNSQRANLPDDPMSNGQGRPGKLAVYAYCVRTSASLTTVSKRVSLPPMPSEGIDRPRTFRVSCPRRNRAVSGGFDGNVSLGDERAGGALTSMRTRDGRGWRTSAISLSDAAA